MRRTRFPPRTMTWVHSCGSVGEEYAGHSQRRIRAQACGRVDPVDRRRTWHAQFPHQDLGAALQACRTGQFRARGNDTPRQRAFRSGDPRQSHARPYRARLGARATAPRAVFRHDPDHRLCRSRNRDHRAQGRGQRPGDQAIPRQPDSERGRTRPRPQVSAPRQRAAQTGVARGMRTRATAGDVAAIRRGARGDRQGLAPADPGPVQRRKRDPICTRFRTARARPSWR